LKANLHSRIRQARIRLPGKDLQGVWPKILLPPTEPDAGLKNLTGNSSQRVVCYRKIEGYCQKMGELP
jgi:hypothetical protein